MHGRIFILSLDIGAGSGSKLGLFRVQEEHFILVNTAEIPSSRYQYGYRAFLEAVMDTFSSLLASAGATWNDCIAGGISSAGLLSSTGTFLRLNNIPFLEGKNLPADFENHTGIYWSIANDANCGGLAEWSGLRHELIYWVLGGGWGGTWINQGGKAMFPCLDWSGQDQDLDLADEPGYATALYKAEIAGVFREHGIDLPGDSGQFDQALWIMTDPDSLTLKGPGGDPGAIRSEFLVSGPGRHRIFTVCSRLSDTSSAEIREVIESPGRAGELISTLRAAGNPLAVTTDSIFGTLMGMAGSRVLESSLKKGLSPDSPVILAGKPALAHEGFLPWVLAILEKNGIRNPVRLSASLLAGQNPNLLGAAVSVLKELES